MRILNKTDESFLQNLCPAVRDDIRTWPIKDQAWFLHHLQKKKGATLASLSFSSRPISPDSISIHSIQSKKESSLSTAQSKKDKKDKCPKGTRRNKQGICVEKKKGSKERCPKGTRRNKQGNCVEVKKKE
jgi:hypothetical protein